MVRVLAGWQGQLEGVEADVIKGLVINAVGLISILYQLMDKGGGIVGSINVGHWVKVPH